MTSPSSILLDPNRSRVVLIGTHTFAHLENLPAVRENILGLEQLFRDPSVLGLPAGHCIRLMQFESGDAIINGLAAAALAATDTLVVYYAGHGLTMPAGRDLYLGLPGTMQGDAVYRTGLEYRRIANVIEYEGRAQRTIVVLDCCYSALAIPEIMAPPPALRDLAEIQGTYVLTATAATRAAVAPIGEQYTAFTGELIGLVAQGVPAGPPLLSLELIHSELDERLARKSRPRPSQRNSQYARKLALARNVAYTAISHQDDWEEERHVETRLNSRPNSILQRSLSVKHYHSQPTYSDFLSKGPGGEEAVFQRLTAFLDRLATEYAVNTAHHSLSQAIADLGNAITWTSDLAEARERAEELDTVWRDILEGRYHTRANYEATLSLAQAVSAYLGAWRSMLYPPEHAQLRRRIVERSVVPIPPDVASAYCRAKSSDLSDRLEIRDATLAYCIDVASLVSERFAKSPSDGRPLRERVHRRLNSHEPSWDDRLKQELRRASRVTGDESWSELWSEVGHSIVVHPYGPPEYGPQPTYTPLYQSDGQATAERFMKAIDNTLRAGMTLHLKYMDATGPQR
jgi:hypothetical protein